MAQQNKLRVPGYNSDTSNANSSFAPTPLDKLSPTDEKAEQELLANKNLGSSEDAEYSNAIRKPSFSKEKSVTVSNHNSVHIVLPTSAAHATSSGTVSNLRRCVVDLSPPTTNGGPFAALTLKNIRDSLVICGQVAGAIHITGVENSVIVTACRQFRMHGSKNTDVYLHCSSRPIIEDCGQIRFAPLPEAYVRSFPSVLPSPSGSLTRAQSTSQIASTANQWDQIDDFKWLQSEPSPNYSILQPADRIKEEVWKTVVPGGHDVSLKDVLRAVTIVQ